MKTLSDNNSKNNRLEILLQKFLDDFAIIPVIGAEIEFYVMGDMPDLASPRLNIFMTVI